MLLNDIKSTLNYQVNTGSTAQERLANADAVMNIAEQIRKTAIRDVLMLRQAELSHPADVKAYYLLLKQGLETLKDQADLETLRQDYYPDVNETLLKGTHNTKASIKMLAEFINEKTPKSVWESMFGKKDVVNVDEILYNLG